nr:helix-turn-helix domain-containing protein [uncultured Devosia sp.]
MPKTPLRDISQVKPDPSALKALAHPVRLRMLSLLRLDGPATASGLATRLGLNSGATSYHLRQLALHGFIVEDTARGNARDRWWKAAHESTNYGEDEGDGEALEAGMAFGQAALNWQIMQMQGALRNQVNLSPEWRKASTVSDYYIPLTSSQAEALTKKLQDLLWEAMQSAPPMGGPYPEGVEPFAVILHSFPRPPEEGDAP